MAEAKPLSMNIIKPDNYDFSTKNINWNLYKPYFLLRTDAVWEKTKLYQYFYSQLKAPLYFNNDKYYLFNDYFHYTRILHKFGEPFTYDQIGESSEDHHEAKLYNMDLPGSIFTNDIESMKNTPRKTSHFLGDWGKETTLLCMIKFFKWMRCNNKSQYKIGSNGFSDENYFKYECFEELNEMNEHCIIYHFKIMFEMYYYRIYNDHLKVYNQSKINRGHTLTRRPTNGRNLYY